jgi:hypothetical protein
MAGNIDTSNNIQNTNSTVFSPYSQQSVGRDSVAGVRNSISDLTSTIQTNAQNNTEDFSIANTSEANTNKYSAQSVKSPGTPGAARDYTASNSSMSQFHERNIGKSRIMTAKNLDFINLGNNKFTYSPGPTPTKGQVISRQEAQDALFYGDVANAMIDNGFLLTAQQRENISKYKHEFSAEFASFDTVNADILYTQAAIVDALITNGATLTPQQETDLGISGSLTGS